MLDQIRRWTLLVLTLHASLAVAQRPPQPPTPPPPAPPAATQQPLARFMVQQRVEVRASDGRWYGASIAAVRADAGYYDVRFDLDPKSTRVVHALYLRAVTGNVPVPNVQPWPENARFALGDRVEIQSGLDRWYPAMVVGHNEMRGYYHVRYDHEQHLIWDAHEDKMRPAR